MKSYDRYKKSGQEWNRLIPDHWALSKLKYVAKNVNEEPSDVETKTILLENIEGFTGRLNNNGETETAAESILKAFLRNDVLFSKLRPYLAKVYHADTDGNCGGELLVLRGSGEIESKYLFYRVLSSDFIVEVNSSTYGTKMPRANWEDFIAHLKIGVPPLPEQRAIADFLGRKTAQIDQFITKKQRLIELLKEERAALINHAVTKSLDPKAKMKPSGIEWLGEIPEHWSVIDLKRIIDPNRRITYGIVQPGEAYPSGRYMVRGQDYSKGWANPDSIFRVSPTIEEPYSRARLRTGDILVTIVGAGCGNVAVVPDWLDGANITQTTARLAIDNSKCISDFAYCLLISEVGQSNVDIWRKGAAQPGLNLGHMNTYKFPMPPLGEQREIVEFINHGTHNTDSIISTIEKEIELIQEYRTALISEAVTGKICVI